jgi:16S rRNA (cytosine967-C5)-methyltransferase
VDPVRCQRIHDNLQRLGLQATVLAADAGAPASWWDGQPFDAILLDAPCTASGIVRRHPDVPWLRREQDVPQLAAQQQRLLEALWPLLAPGGHLLYCTCSVFKQEGEEQIAGFLQRHADAVARPAPGHLLPKHHNKDAGLGENGTLGTGTASASLVDHDGFFYALLAKQP